MECCGYGSVKHFAISSSSSIYNELRDSWNSCRLLVDLVFPVFGFVLLRESKTMVDCNLSTGGVGNSAPGIISDSPAVKAFGPAPWYFINALIAYSLIPYATLCISLHDPLQLAHDANSCAHSYCLSLVMFVLLLKVYELIALNWYFLSSKTDICLCCAVQGLIWTLLCFSGSIKRSPRTNKDGKELLMKNAVRWHSLAGRFSVHPLHTR